ncbi:polysaccharide deacetylase [Leptospira inadai serovar Lyme str. 10]|uniref:Polysaccharide deacetylase n=2 Tax=Leptospira inadai serovar Lyme TaxID=293084 RepID=V6HBG2_9LEPT|nr:polysaccharide deacetylase family protein [Leptospira inadai]EQA35943.1 polysaccharide deacetylase [Leptospira inadai serovar Lyme str. 10]PNV76841.1 polysaccharide deacetylase [Leptospira inadai serovar Lyme]
MNRFQRPTLAIILLSLFFSSFTVDSTPVKNFLNPDASKEKKDQEASKNKSPLPNPRTADGAASESTVKPEKPNLEAKTTDKKGESDLLDEEKPSSPVKKKRKTKKHSTGQNNNKETKKDLGSKSPRTYENAVPGVSGLPPKADYDASRENPSGSGHGKGIPVLCYHHLVDNGNPMGGYNLDPSLLEEQFKYLKNLGYQTVSLDQFYAYIQGKAAADFPKKPILLTFDDGSLTHKTVLVPLLKKYGFRASIFIYPTVISNPKYKFYLSWSELKEALDSGVLDLGSHTVYHPKLPAMKRAEILKQLKDSKSILESKTGRTVQDLAYPFGLYDVRVIEEAKAAGYRMAFTVNPGKNVVNTYAYTIHRSLIPWGQSQSRFNSILSASPPDKIKLGILDGSWVKPGETFSVTVDGLDPNTVKMQIRGKDAIQSRKSGREYSVRIPDFKTKTSYPAFVISGKTKDGRKSETQFLFVNRKEFSKDPD